MLVFLTTYLLAAAGSLVCSSVHLVLKFVACKRQDDTIAVHLGRGESAVSEPFVDPVLKFGCIISCYGAIALGLVSALPGPLALERTMLAFACMCVGGLIGEIASTRTATELPNLDLDEAAQERRKRTALRLSLALTMTLNLAFALLSTGQSLIEIVPPPEAGHAAREPQLEPIIVIGQRSHNPIGENTAAL